MTRTAPELAAFLGITPRQLAVVLGSTIMGPPYTVMDAAKFLEIANTMKEVDLRASVAVTRLTHPEYFA